MSATTTTKVTKIAKVDIRSELPLAVKGGTSSKPIWTIGDKEYKFIKPVNKHGLDPEQKKVRLGNRITAKYKAGTTKNGADLLFVGVFAVVGAVSAAPVESELETAAA